MFTLGGKKWAIVSPATTNSTQLYIQTCSHKEIVALENRFSHRYFKAAVLKICGDDVCMGKGGVRVKLGERGGRGREGQKGGREREKGSGGQGLHLV